MSSLTNDSKTIEGTVLRYGTRGMDILRPLLPEDNYSRCANRILQNHDTTILLITGFYVAGAAETDGPPGTFCLANTLTSLGFHVVVVTDEYCRGLFEEYGIDVLYMPISSSDEDFRRLLKNQMPSALISVERCGKNRDGLYANMRGISITEHTVPLDRLFELAEEEQIYTIGIGDGGNEIGMGLVSDTIRSSLQLNPCVIKTSDLLIATVSNWGAYALSAALINRSGCGSMPSYSMIADFIMNMADQGYVDGISHEAKNWVDGFPPEIEEEIYHLIQSFC